MNSADIAALVPNSDDLLMLGVEEHGKLILKLLMLPGDINEGIGPTSSGRVNQHNFFSRANDWAAPPKYGPERQKKVDEALLGAWAWLAGQGLLAKDPSHGQDWFRVTKAGLQFSQGDTTAFRNTSLLPKDQLHLVIAENVYPVFLRGKYDTAILEAFRQIEIAVRQAGKLSQDLVGNNLMRTAFSPAENNRPAGPLADMQRPVAEQRAMCDLFAGAFGFYRNSTGHRHVHTDPAEAVEIIMFASQLMRIVDRVNLQTRGGVKP